MTPIISVIVPVYNTKNYLTRCINSILGQSFMDFELLLIDDGSNDGSGTICETYSETDSRIRVFHKENGGVSSARNYGLNYAVGEWVCFVDSDDELNHDGLRVMAESISNEVDLVMTGYEIFDEKGNRVSSVESHVSKQISNEMAVREMYAPSDFLYQGYCWNKLFRMSLIRMGHLHFASGIHFNEDRLFVTQYICTSSKAVFYTTIPSYKYYQREGSAMQLLRKSFNPLIMTEMDAQISMRGLVMNKFGDKLMELADYGVFCSYRMILGVMRKGHGFDTNSLKKQLRHKVAQTIGLRCFFCFEIARNVNRVKKRLKTMATKMFFIEILA